MDRNVARLMVKSGMRRKLYILSRAGILLSSLLSSIFVCLLAYVQQQPHTSICPRHHIVNDDALAMEYRKALK